MFAYLQLETGDAVPESHAARVLRDKRGEHFEWLRGLGVPFPEERRPSVKASLPPDDCTLYFSGNEPCPPYCDAADTGNRADTDHLGRRIDRAPHRNGATPRHPRRRRSSFIRITRADRLVIDRRGER